MLCPRCDQTELTRWTGGRGSDAFFECPKCRGAWIAVDAFRRIAADRGRQIGLLADLPSLKPSDESAARPDGGPALPCPQCARDMRHFDYAGASGIHVDLCGDHGLWCDRDELRRIVDFMQRGGLTRSVDRHGLTGERHGPPPRRGREQNSSWDVFDELVDLFLLWI